MIMNLAHCMVEAGRDYAAYPAIARGTKVLHDYATLANRVGRLAAAMTAAYELTPGDRVAVILPNRVEYLELLYAAWHAGLVVVPINAKLHTNEFAFILENSGARLCFVSAKHADAVRPLAKGGSFSVVDVDSNGYAEMLHAEPVAAASARTAQGA